MGGGEGHTEHCKYPTVRLMKDYLIGDLISVTYTSWVISVIGDICNLILWILPDTFLSNNSFDAVLVKVDNFILGKTVSGHLRGAQIKICCKTLPDPLKGKKMASMFSVWTLFCYLSVVIMVTIPLSWSGPVLGVSGSHWLSRRCVFCSMEGGERDIPSGPLSLTLL